MSSPVITRRSKAVLRIDLNHKPIDTVVIYLNCHPQGLHYVQGWQFDDYMEEVIIPGLHTCTAVDEVFHLTNAPTEILKSEVSSDLLAQIEMYHRNWRSLSVGDVVWFWNAYFVCEAIGWRKL